MSSLNSRSERATRLKQTVVGEEKEPASGKKGTRSNSGASSDKSKSPRNNIADSATPKSDESHVKSRRSISKNNDNESPSIAPKGEEKSKAGDKGLSMSNKMTPAKPPKAKTNEKTSLQSTPPSAIRRSGRAPVPSSRFKDMEMGLSSARKRSTPSVNLSEESDVEQESAKKRVRKTSERSQQSISDNEKTNDSVKHSQTNLEIVEITTTPEVVENINVPLCIEEMIQSNLEEAKPQQDEPEVKPQPAPVTSETSEAPVVTPVMAQSVTYRAEQDVVMQTSEPNQAQEQVEKVVELSSSSVPSLSIGGQQVTFTQKDGETLAFVTIPTSLAEGEVAHEQITVSPPDPQESNIVHGHIVRDKKAEAPFTAALIGQDGQTFYNLSIEATKISTILKNKPPPKPVNPAKGHGRVLRTEQWSNVVVKTTLVPSTTVSSVSVFSKDSAKSTTVPSPPLPSPETPEGRTAKYSLPILHKPKKPTTKPHLHGSIQPPEKGPPKVALPSPTVVKPPPGETPPTIIRIPQDLPSKKTSPMPFQWGQTISTSSDSNVRTVIKPFVDPTKPPVIPKTASEILMQRLKEQQKRVIVKESVKVADNLTRESPDTNENKEIVSVAGGKESKEEVSETENGNEADQQLKESDDSDNISSAPHEKRSQLQEHTTEETNLAEELVKSEEIVAAVNEGGGEPLESNESNSMAPSVTYRAEQEVVMQTSEPNQAQPSEQSNGMASQQADESNSITSQQADESNSMTSQQADESNAMTSQQADESNTMTSQQTETTAEELVIVSNMKCDGVKTEQNMMSDEPDHVDHAMDISSAESAEAYESATVLTEMKNTEPRVVKANLPSPTESSFQDSNKPKEMLKKGETKERVLKMVDNGVEYDVRIVSEEEVAEEIVDYTEEELQQKTKKEDRVEEGSTVVLKQEETAEDEEFGTTKQTSGTQTVYSPRVETASSPPTSDGPPVHRLATVVDESGGKKQIYYVSVIPNKGLIGKGRNSAYSSAASWVISENGMYCCGKCNYKTDRKANFYKHRRLHTGAKPHVCPVCQYKAGTSSNLKRHMGIHKDIREHKCDICGLSFRQKIHLERHIKYKHEEKSVECPLCDYVCANEQPDLKMHMKRKHSNGASGEVVSCPECGIEVGSKKDLKQHMKFHKDGPELKLFCKECSFVTDCQSRLRRHTAIHSKLKPFQCGVCNYRAAQKEHVLRHLRTQHKIEVKRECKRPWRRHKTIEADEKERADFTSGDKIFACNHCTMRFAKLINLYKHLHTQHSDIMPSETEGNFYCVVCEFSTTTKKNLLVHMRRHNMTDQTPPTHVYSCVLCRYVNPKRRNLFQHMRKKHNIDVSHQVEGVTDAEDELEGENGLIRTTDKSSSPNVSSNTNTVSAVEVPDPNVKSSTGELAGVANMIKIEDLTRTAGAGGEGDGVPDLVIDTRGTNVTEVVQTTGTIQQHSVEALEGLQALAEQAGLIDNIIEEQVPVLDEQQTIMIEQAATSSEEQIVSTVETVGGHMQQIIETNESSSGEGELSAGVELTEDQLSSLRTGDMVEMEGELYVVELTQDPGNPNKQMLSFVPVPVSSVTLSQDS